MPWRRNLELTYAWMLDMCFFRNSDHNFKDNKTRRQDKYGPFWAPLLIDRCLLYTTGSCEISVLWFHNIFSGQAIFMCIFSGFSRKRITDGTSFVTSLISTISAQTVYLNFLSKYFSITGQNFSNDPWCAFTTSSNIGLIRPMSNSKTFENFCFATCMFIDRSFCRSDRCIWRKRTGSRSSDQGPILLPSPAARTTHAGVWKMSSINSSKNCHFQFNFNPPDSQSII